MVLCSLWGQEPRVDRGRALEEGIFYGSFEMHKFEFFIRRKRRDGDESNILGLRRDITTNINFNSLLNSLLRSNYRRLIKEILSDWRLTRRVFAAA